MSNYYFGQMPVVDQRLEAARLAIQSLTTAHGGAYSMNPSMVEIARRADQIREYALTGEFQ